MRQNWNGKPYYSLDFHLKETFGRKVYKLALDGGMTCPNRDGTLGRGGCIFCSEGGSGDFAARRSSSVREQVQAAKERVRQKVPADAAYIAYFQSFTNTYAPLSYLRPLFTEALSLPEICALSIGTRPDCLPDETVNLLSELSHTRFPSLLSQEEKPVWVELGLQTIHEDTALKIHRGYPLPVFEDAFSRLRAAKIPVIVHVILGLPGEDRERMLDTIRYLAKLRPDGVKLQLLHVLKGTGLCRLYESGGFKTMELDEYLSLLGDCIRILPEEIVIHRLSGDGPKKLLAAPLWSANKKLVLNSISRYFKENGIFQGMDCALQADDNSAVVRVERI